MNIFEFKKKLDEIENLKKEKNYRYSKLAELFNLPSVNGICELYFNNYPFYMLNISNDDAVVLKYLWRNFYEELSLNLWYKITRREGIFFDIGSHTGIYSIIGNLNNDRNKIISIEAFFLNYSRLLSNLKINNISNNNNCYLAAASNENGIAKFKVKTPQGYHSSGGRISDSGKYTVTKIKIDDFNLNTQVKGIKIDTEGHEYQVMEGSIKIINKDNPDIIFEINEQSFDMCLNFLKQYKYNFYFLDETKKKIKKVDKFHNNLIRPEGSNCLATVNETWIK